MRPPRVLVSSAILLAVVSVAVIPGGCRESEVQTPAPAPAIFVPPLHDAQQGDELRLRRGDEEWLYRVVSATDDEVSVDFFVFRNGELVEDRTENLRWHRNTFGLPVGFVIREFRRDRIEVGGRAYDCWRLKAHARDGVRYYWVTDALPVSGFLRIALDDRGKPLLQTAADAVVDGTR